MTEKKKKAKLKMALSNQIIEKLGQSEFRNNSFY